MSKLWFHCDVQPQLSSYVSKKTIMSICGTMIIIRCSSSHGDMRQVLHYIFILLTLTKSNNAMSDMISNINLAINTLNNHQLPDIQHGIISRENTTYYDLILTLGHPIIVLTLINAWSSWKISKNRLISLCFNFSSQKYRIHAF